MYFPSNSPEIAPELVKRGGLNVNTNFGVLVALNSELNTIGSLCLYFDFGAYAMNVRRVQRKNRTEGDTPEMGKSCCDVSMDCEMRRWKIPLRRCRFQLFQDHRNEGEQRHRNQVCLPCQLSLQL